MTDAVVLQRSADGVSVVTLNRPSARNALDPAMVTALDEALDVAEADPTIGAVVLEGAGSAFCAGADLRHLEGLASDGESPLPFLAAISRLVRRLEQSPLPIVAALHGAVVAGGLELALGCDVVIAGTDALIGDGHVKNDLLPAGGSSVRLPRKVGAGIARWMILTGELVPASRLAGTGWIHEVVPASEVRAASLEAARVLAARSGPAQSRLKSLLADLDDLDVSGGLARELEVFETHWRRHDVGAALRTFLHMPSRAIGD